MQGTGTIDLWDEVRFRLNSGSSPIEGGNVKMNTVTGITARPTLLGLRGFTSSQPVQARCSSELTIASYMLLCSPYEIENSCRARNTCRGQEFNSDMQRTKTTEL